MSHQLPVGLGICLFVVDSMGDDGVIGHHTDRVIGGGKGVIMTANRVVGRGQRPYSAA